MNCTEFRENALDLAENTLNSDVKVRCLEHRQKCSECAELLNELSAGLQYINAEKQQEPAPWMQERLIKRMKAGNRSEINYVPVIFRLAAVLVLAIATGMVLNKFQGNGNDEKTEGTSSVVAPATDDLLDTENTILSLNE